MGIILEATTVLAWAGDRLLLLRQDLLPGEVKHATLKTPKDVADAIRDMWVRGAPAIGVAAAYGLALARNLPLDDLKHVGEILKQARPTAVNLAWAVDRVLNVAQETQPPERASLIESTAKRIEAADKDSCRSIGLCGVDLVPNGGRVLVHCNAGALATTGIGTALAPLYVARELGKSFDVFCTETRPWGQGARLTQWELNRRGIPAKVIVDSAAASQMRSCSLVLVGADRVAANGDVANKIGTLGLAIVADYFRVPFWVAMPASTFDSRVPNGSAIPIEYRDAGEICKAWGVDFPALNPGFDVTPAHLVTGYLTDRGKMHRENLSSLGV